MPTSPSTSCGSSIFDPRKIKLAKEHFKYFHPNSLGRFFSSSEEEMSSFHPPTHSYSLSSNPNFDLKAWQMAPEVFEDTLYLCPWCIMEEKKNQDRNTLKASNGNIWSPQVFLPADNNYLFQLEEEAPGKSEDIMKMDWNHRDYYGFDKLRRLASKGPDTKDLECITDADISDLELDPNEEAKIMEPLNRRRLAMFFDVDIEEEEEEEQFFDAVDDSPESGWESLEERQSVQEEEEEDQDEEEEEEEERHEENENLAHLFDDLMLNNSHEEETEDEFIEDDDNEGEAYDEGEEEEEEEEEQEEEEELPSFNSEDGAEEESIDSEADPLIESSMNNEDEDNAPQVMEEPRPVYVSESERYHKEWLKCQDKIKDSKIKKYIDEKLKKILSVAFEESGLEVRKSNAEIFERIPNMNRDEVGDFEIADASELQDLCILSFAARKEKFFP